MDIGSVLSQLRGMTGSLPTMQFGGGAPAAPAVPADGAMQPTIGPGTAPAAAAAAPALKMGLPSGGLLAMMRGRTDPQGLVGLLQQLSARQQQAGPMTAPPGGAGMLSPLLSPSQPSQIGANLPLDIKPMDLF